MPTPYEAAERNRKTMPPLGDRVKNSMNVASSRNIHAVFSGTPGQR